MALSNWLCHAKVRCACNLMPTFRECVWCVCVFFFSLDAVKRVAGGEVTRAAGPGAAAAIGRGGDDVRGVGRGTRRTTTDRPLSPAPRRQPHRLQHRADDR
jgi:hypothetical protein